jgi:hypothetical protein
MSFFVVIYLFVVCRHLKQDKYCYNVDYYLCALLWFLSHLYIFSNIFHKKNMLLSMRKLLWVIDPEPNWFNIILIKFYSLSV